MKISLITDHWKKSSGGGVKTYVMNLVEELEKRENFVTIIFEKGEDVENYKVGENKFLFSIRSFLILKKLRPDLILSQETWYCLLAGCIYKKLFGSVLIHTFHTEPEIKLPLLGKLFVEFLLNRCNYVAYVSRGLEKKIDDIWELNFKSKRAIIYAGANRKKVLDEDIKKFREKFNLQNGQIILLGLGLTELKYKAEGAKLLIKAVKILEEANSNITLILTREGRYSNDLREFVRKENIKNIIFTGDIDNPYIPLKLCDIYTHISLGEGLPIALLEAMIMAKPIIATPVGGIAEAINDNINGLLVEPNPKIIASKIRLLIENSKMAKELGKNAKKTAEERFTWVISVDNIINMYNKELKE